MVAPIVYSWANGVSGNWNAASNWTPVGVPGAADTALIKKSGTYTVTSSFADGVAVLEMAKKATLAVTADSLAVTSGTGTARWPAQSRSSTLRVWTWAIM